MQIVGCVWGGASCEQLNVWCFCEASCESYESHRSSAIQVIVLSIGAAAAEEGRSTAARLVEDAAAAAAAAVDARYTDEERRRAALASAIHKALEGFETPGADGCAAVGRAIEALCPSDARDGVEKKALEEAFKLTSARRKSSAARRAARLLIGMTTNFKRVQKSLDHASMSVASAALHSALGAEPYAEPGTGAREAGAAGALDRARKVATEHEAARAAAAEHEAARAAAAAAHE
jgi:hypothetical protein